MLGDTAAAGQPGWAVIDSYFSHEPERQCYEIIYERERHPTALVGANTLQKIRLRWC